MISTLETLRARFSSAAAAAFGLADVDPILVEASRPDFGDFQFNGAMPLAKTLKMPPRQVADKILEHLHVDDLSHTPSVAGPGFINLKLKAEHLHEQLHTVAQDSRLGIPQSNAQKVIVDFSSPNIAKEMHVGHLRSTIIGDSIARVLTFAGHDVLRLNHVGDWGTQFGMLICYLKESHPEALTEESTFEIGDLVDFYRRSKVRFDEDEDFKERARGEVVLLQSGDEESIRAWTLLCDQSRHAFNDIYDVLDIHLTERGESFYNPYLAAVLEDLNEAGLLTVTQGAEAIFVPGFQNREGEPLPLIVRKSDGGYNYATTDLAAIRYRINVDLAKTIVYVTDAGQGQHFAQVFAAARMAGWVPDDVTLVHVPFGLVLGPDGKKLKTRSGDTVRLKALLDEAIERAREMIEARVAEEGRQETPEFLENFSRDVGIAAVKYADLSQNRTGDYIFSFDKMLALQGNTAPYMLYAYARVQGIYRKAKTETGSATVDGAPSDASFVLTEPSEFELAKHLLRLDEIVTGIAQDYMPNRLCAYLFELSQKFNVFYENCQVLGSAPDLRASRLGLCDLTARTLALGLSLLGIPTVERL